MQATESIEEFYKRVFRSDGDNFTLNNTGAGHFNVFPRDINCRTTPFSRRDFYKVSLVLGTGRLCYGDRWIELDKPALLFSTPLVPYAWEGTSPEQKGWYCLFTDTFLQPSEKNETLQDSPLFRPGEMPFFFLDRQQQKEMAAIFLKMMEEMASDYLHKFDLLRNYLHLVIHTAMKMQPAVPSEINITASYRITHQFLELLERQFPIEAPTTPLLVKTANHFAENLSVHVNHLNRALKEVTGKTTTEHISGRIIKEAMALLRHSDWNISQIAYGLGFEYPAYFNIFFKKQTGHTPMEARGTLV